MTNTKRVNWTFLGMVLFNILFPLFFAPIIRMINLNGLMVLSQVMLFAPPLILVFATKTKPSQWMPFKPLKISTILLCVLFALLLQPLIICINAFSMMFVENRIADSLNTINNSGNFWTRLLIIAVMPAFCEEFIFRGVFYHGYRENGIFLGTLACGISFGLMHMNFNQFCYAFVLGVIFCLLVEATGSIFSSMIAHFVINGWSVIMAEIASKMPGGMEQAAQVEYTHELLFITFCVYGILAVITCLMAAGVFILIAKSCNRLPHIQWLFRKKRLAVRGGRYGFITLGFVLAAGICLFYMMAMELMY